MKKKDEIKKIITIVTVLSIIGIINLKVQFFTLPDIVNISKNQSDLFTVSALFAGFSFSVLGLLLGVFSEKIMIKLKGTKLIERKCHCIVESITFFCVSGVFSLILMLGIDKFISRILNNFSFFDKIKDMPSAINSILFINSIGFMIFGLYYFVLSMKNLMLIIEKIYGFNKEDYKKKEDAFKKSREINEQKRKNECEDQDDDEDLNIY